MKVSVVVVIYNDSYRLRDCLQSLRQVDDILVVDIGSSDDSADIAKSMGISVIEHQWVPIGEMVLNSIIYDLNNDWIFRVDPDEVIPPQLLNDIFQLEIDNSFGIINLPYQYYFLNKKLNNTVWGGVRHIPRIIHRKRVNVTSDVHRALQCLPGYETYDLPYTNVNAVQHYWIDSYQQLFLKHNRYMQMEGESLYNSGMRYSWALLLQNTLMHFYLSFIKCSGWRGGWIGWFLSFFYSWYIFMSWLSLRKYEKSLKD